MARFVHQGSFLSKGVVRVLHAQLDDTAIRQERRRPRVRDNASLCPAGTVEVECLGSKVQHVRRAHTVTIARPAQIRVPRAPLGDMARFQVHQTHSVVDCATPQWDGTARREWQVRGVSCVRKARIAVVEISALARHVQPVALVLHWA